MPVLTERFRCRLYAYVLMENHYHLLLETREANLSRALQWLNVSYVGARKAPAWLEPGRVLALGGGRRGQWSRNYREDCEQAVREGNADCPWDNLVSGLVLGSLEFIEELKEEIAPGAVGKEVREALMQRPTWKQVVEVIEQMKKMATVS